MYTKYVDLTSEDDYINSEAVFLKLKVTYPGALPANAMCIKIMTLYFKFLWESVFAGYVFEIPKFGSVYIVKREDPEKLKEYKLYSYLLRKKKAPSLNYKRLGYFYSIFCSMPFNKKGLYKFQAETSNRRKLKDILFKTEMEYSTTVICH